jgi:hypothetical protein
MSPTGLGEIAEFPDRPKQRLDLMERPIKCVSLTQLALLIGNCIDRRLHTILRCYGVKQSLDFACSGSASAQP